MQKQIAYTGLRLALYEYLAGSSEDDLPMHMKLLYATLTTGLGILIANPADVVQTKFIAYRTKPRTCSMCAPLVQPGMAPVQGVCLNEISLAARGTSTAVAGKLEHIGRSARHTNASGSPWGSRGFCGMSSSGGATAAVDRLRVGAVLQGDKLHSQGIFANSSLQRHVYGHHLQRRHHSGMYAHRLLWYTAAASPRGRQPLQVSLGTNLWPRQFSDAKSAQPTSTGAALVCKEPFGPRTVTGVPLQNARMAYYIIVREEGLLNGLYRGFWANFACSCMQGAAELVTYDVTKTAAINAGYKDSYPVHLAAGAPKVFESGTLRVADARSACWDRLSCINDLFCRPAVARM
jgi:hypothetical protein